MTPLEIIRRFAEYVGFESDRTSYTFEVTASGMAYSRTYEMDRALRRVPDINECDPTGSLALLYLKRQFESDLRKQKVSLFDAINIDGNYDGDRRMWSLFNSGDVSSIEEDLSNRMSRLTENLTGRKLLGEAGVLIGLVADSVERTVDGLTKCHDHVWLTDGMPLPRFDILPTHVSVFHSMAEALATISNSADGLTLAFVQQDNSVDGFFGIFAKAGNNVLSCDDLILEVYPGQHRRSRTNRYLEGKSFDLFPYEQLVDYSGSDYKGYVTEASTSVESLPLRDLDEADCVPLVLAMSCFLSRIEGKVLDKDHQLYVTSLSPRFLELSGTGEALAISNDSAIVKANDIEVLLSISEKDALSNSIGLSAGGSALATPESMSPGQANQKKELVIASLDFSDFRLDREKIASSVGNEFIGVRDTIEKVAFKEARRQVSCSLMEKMHAEFIEFGGLDGLSTWYDNKVREGRERLVRACAENYRRLLQAESDGCFSRKETFFTASYRVGGNPGSRNVIFGQPEFSPYMRICTLNDVEKRVYRKYGRSVGPFLLNEKGQRCSICYIFKPYDFSDLEALFDMSDAPSFVRTWSSDFSMFGREGNSLLSIVDPLSELRSPLAGYTWEGAGAQERNLLSSRSDRFGFFVQIGFTKRDMKALIKQLDSEDLQSNQTNGQPEGSVSNG